MTDTLLSIPSNGTAGTVAAQNYTDYTYTYTATQTQTYITFEFRQDPSYWGLDDVSFTSSTGTQLVTNGGFETGNLTGWTLIGTQGLQAAGTVRSGSPGTTYGSTHSGNYYFKDGAVGGVDGIYQAIATNPGQQYTIEFWLAGAAANSPRQALALVQVGNNLYQTIPADLAIAPLSDTGAQGDGITSVARPTVTGTGAVGDTITLYDGSTAIGTTTVANNGTWSLALTNALSDGTHTLTATQTDGSGNVSPQSQSFALTIDTTAPAVTAALLHDTGQSASDQITSDATLTGVGDPNSTVTITEGATTLGTATTNAQGQWSFAPQSLTDGIHTLVASQTDTAGNVGSAQLTLTLDTTAPVAPTAPSLQLASDSGAHGDGITNVAAPTLTGTAEAGSTVSIYDGTTVLGTALVGQNGTWSFAAGTLVDGVHQISTIATDQAGNVSPQSQPFALTIDTTAPAVTAALLHDTGQSASDQITSDATLTGVGDPNSTVTITEGATTLGTATTNAQGQWSFAPQSLTDGIHTLVASQTDTAGNVGSAQLTLTLDTAAPADTYSVDRTTIGLFRFFSTVDGSHFMTSSVAETNALLASRPDLQSEGMPLSALNPTTAAADPNAAPVFRFFDSIYGTHFYTDNASERDNVIATRSDLEYEGVGFYEHTSQQPGDSAVYRFFDASNGTHLYTSDMSERASILATRPDLKDEGIGFYAPKIS